MSASRPSFRSYETDWAWCFAYSGAYCAGMSTKNYNSFPEAAEVMRDTKGGLHLIRARQGLKQIYENERPLPASAAL